MTPTPSKRPLLEVENLSVSFHTREGIIQAVSHATFAINQGEVLAIVGESGSGKSVCCYSLLKLLPTPPAKIESGRALFNGQDLLQSREKTLRNIRGNRISMIFQDPMTSLNPYLTIGTQLIEPLRYHKGLTRKAAWEKALTALAEVGIDQGEKRLHQYPHEFSGGMRQRVMIAMALITEPELLIADEPTTALDVTVQAQIFELLATIQRKHNIAVIFISHDLSVVAQLADRVLVMRQGQIVEQGNTQAVFYEPQHDYTKALLAAIPDSAKPETFQYHAGKTPSPILAVNDLHVRYKGETGFFQRNTQGHYPVQGVSFELQPGEVLGLVGESGCGKSTLAKTIMRLLHEEQGSISLKGQDLTQLPHKALGKTRKTMQVVFQDPYASLNPRMPIYDMLAEPLQLHNIVAKNEISARIQQLMRDVGLSPADIRKYPHEFSGGQRQRLAIARALAVEPQVLIADEPVSALDVTVQAQILELLLTLIKKYQLSMLFISHDLGVIRYICDRVAVMSQGKIIEIDETETVFNHPQHAFTKALLAATPKLPAVL